MTILGIESSCDDTAAAVLTDGRLLAHIVATQLAHARYGGIVPEIASRLHEQNIVPVVRAALEKSGTGFSDLSAVAVTHGPGLAGALAVGVSFAKGLAQALGIPLIGVNHMEGHLWASFLPGESDALSHPFICLLASGGHTQLWQVNGSGDYQLLGKSLDDAAGEAFDKGARMLGLSYPGGPAIQSAAEGGQPDAVSFPRPLAGDPQPNFSFSGLKTALLYYLKKLTEQEIKAQRADIAASYQAAIIDCLIDRLQVAVRLTGVHSVCVAGGVSANASLRSRLKSWSRTEPAKVIYPPLEFCTDNAAMIAMAGYHHYKAGRTDDFTLPIVPGLRLDS